MSSISSTTAAGVTDPFATRTTAGTDSSAATKDMFLKLLVAQIKNQDPLTPADGTQFVAQLAQFTQLEQTLAMASDLSAIRQDLDKTTQTADTSGQAAGTAQ